MGLRFGTANGTSHSSTERFSSCGKIWHGKPIPLPYLKTVTGIQGNEEYGDIDSSEDEFTDCDETDANLVENSRLEVGEKSREDDIDDNDDVLEDLCIVSSGALGLTSFEHVKVSPTSPFVSVLAGDGNQCIIRKTSLCWLLSSGDTKISSDRLHRVQASNVDHSTKTLNALKSFSSYQDFPIREESISIGS